MTIPDSSGYHYMMENGSIELPCKPEEERRIVQELTAKAESNLREGNLYYVISSRWFMAWQRYTGQTEGAFPFENHSIPSQSLILSNAEDRPGPIDNSDIIVNGGDNKDDDPQLLRTLEEGRDYVLVPQDVWEKLLKCERKLFLTPLVTILEDAQSGADIDLAVNRMLSPLRRKTFTTSTTTHSTGENGSALCAMEEQTNNSSTQLGSSIQSTEETEPDGMSSREFLPALHY
ncbi:UNVERIFIED_CONTAM: Ubiquitin carboxyl-terminal hydrolase 10 [Sesamum radiatum]|uniref:Ubiquitin carboxyl-terminal hydrolase 10 n=1 Tax=Sesamum radiatum TaxID=300843 RepID=A0AAW2MEY9_SESRA